MAASQRKRKATGADQSLQSSNAAEGSVPQRRVTRSSSIAPVDRLEPVVEPVKKRRPVRSSVAPDSLEETSPKQKRTKRSVSSADNEEGQKKVKETKKVKSKSGRKIVNAAVEEVLESDSSSSQSDSKVLDIKFKLEELLSRDDATEFDDFVSKLQGDNRASVVSLIEKAERSRWQQEREMERLIAMTEYERKVLMKEEARLKTGVNALSENAACEYMSKNFYIIGVDEVGVGPLAGPIVSCAVAFQFPISNSRLRLLAGIDDSKKLNSSKRQELVGLIEKECFNSSLGIVTSTMVDNLNPRQGSIEAMQMAVKALKLPPGSTYHVLIDHHQIQGLPKNIQQTSITKGDSKSICIAAASILAKVWRDDYMVQLHEQYPEFAFDKNAGYGTPIHLAQLRKGLTCPEHRFSFEPVRQAQRKAMGLPPDVPAKKTRSISAKRQVEEVGDDVTHVKGESDTVEEPGKGEGPTTSTKSSLLSLTYWANWLLPAARPVPT